MDHQRIASLQVDLGLEVLLKLFSKAGLKEIFSLAESSSGKFSENSQRIFMLREDYIHIIDEGDSISAREKMKCLVIWLVQVH